MTRKTEVAVVVALLFAAMPVSAAPSAQDVAAARAFFQEGRKLVADGKAQEACPKFEESLRLDPGKGTQFNLADCYEKTGRYASAWGLFLEVVAASRADNQAAHAQKAQERADAVAPMVPRLTLLVPESSRVPDLVVRRDGVDVGRGVLGTAVPVDPGDHVVTATAPGHEAFSRTVSLAKGAAVTVEIPALRAAVSAAPPPVVPPPPVAASTSAAPLPPPPPPASEGGGAGRTVALVLGGAGVVALGVGSYFALSSLSSKSSANGDGQCDPNGTVCHTSQGAASRDDAKRAGNFATGFSLAGLVLAGTGVTLWLTSAPKSGGVGWHVAPVVGARDAGLSFGGSY